MASPRISYHYQSANQAREKMADKAHTTTPFLRTFWSAFPWDKCDKPCATECQEKSQCLLGCLGRYKKLEMLRIMCEIRIARPAWNKKRRYEMRKQFDRYAGGFDVVSQCFVCGGEWHHRHHIIQIQYGGGNVWWNIVRLCRRCHRAVHNP